MCKATTAIAPLFPRRPRLCAHVGTTLAAGSTVSEMLENRGRPPNRHENRVGIAVGIGAVRAIASGEFSLWPLASGLSHGHGSHGVAKVEGSGVGRARSRTMHRCGVQHQGRISGVLRASVRCGRQQRPAQERVRVLLRAPGAVTAMHPLQAQRLYVVCVEPLVWCTLASR